MVGITKKEIADSMYYAAMAAINHMNNNPEGFYPKECDCDSCERKRICEAVSLLNKEYDSIIKKLDDE